MLMLKKGTESAFVIMRMSIFAATVTFIGVRMLYVLGGGNIRAYYTVVFIVTYRFNYLARRIGTAVKNVPSAFGSAGNVNVVCV